MAAEYGHWLQPIENLNDSSQTGLAPVSSHSANPKPQRRGRGRPRITQTRDNSTLEKRRAQIRNAQRTYQKRKESEAASIHRRRNELLEVLSSLSTDIEVLLRLASETGCLDEGSEVSAQIRRLWASYNTAINNPCVLPELRSLQTKNEERRTEHQKKESSRIETVGRGQTPRPDQPSSDSILEHDRSDVDLDLLRVRDTTLITSFHHAFTNSTVNGRTIWHLVQERQAVFNAAKPPA
ncbi:hypothetical protein CC78DRAFT_600700 [Lojkania enalia]|uniref:BZIP domain-containing protein n=1 Tax=Lojkania enalia TaxID=147567 RepID=A0A9P4KBB9_9PLEO|nr:hypothetical protein CC78DRAFT_600700 [Didymosphaeria enalia]